MSSLLKFGVVLCLKVDFFKCSTIHTLGWSILMFAQSGITDPQPVSFRLGDKNVARLSLFRGTAYGAPVPTCVHVLLMPPGQLKRSAGIPGRSEGVQPVP